MKLQLSKRSAIAVFVGFPLVYSFLSVPFMAFWVPAEEGSPPLLTSRASAVSIGVLILVLWIATVAAIALLVLRKSGPIEAWTAFRVVTVIMTITAFAVLRFIFGPAENELYVAGYDGYGPLRVWSVWVALAPNLLLPLLLVGEIIRALARWEGGRSHEQ
jgi:hypothetical protein